MNEVARISVVPLLAEHDRRPRISFGIATGHADLQIGACPVLMAAMQQQFVAQPMDFCRGDGAMDRPEGKADPPDRPLQYGTDGTGRTLRPDIVELEQGHVPPSCWR